MKRKPAKKNKIVSVKDRSVQNSNSMLAGIFDNGDASSYSPLSMSFGLGAVNQYNPLTLNRVLLSYAYMTIGVIQTFIDQPVEDAFRGGVEIETDELDEEDLDKLQDVLEECDDYKEVKDSMKWAKLFGGAGLIVNTDQDPKEELDFDAIDENSPLSFIAADRWELTLNFLLEDRVPCPYNYYGQQIHKSRVMKVNGKEAPSFIRRRLQGWGMSELERTIRDINSYNKNQDVIYELLDEAKTDVWKLQALNSQLLSGAAQQQLSKRLNLATNLKNFHNALIMDKDDDYEQKQISFGGLAEMQNQNRIGMAASVRMPMTKLFGQSASGFSSGEDDIENYNALIESEVRAKALKVISPVIKLRCQQLFGFIPEHMEIRFNPLRVLSAEQEENVKDKKFQRGSALYSQGMLNGKEYADYLKKENVQIMNTEVGDGIRDPEPPQAESMQVDMPQKVVSSTSGE